MAAASAAPAATKCSVAAAAAPAAAPPRPATPLRLLAFGDSLTEGFQSGGMAFHSYAIKLRELLVGALPPTVSVTVDEQGCSGEFACNEMQVGGVWLGLQLLRWSIRFDTHYLNSSQNTCVLSCRDAPPKTETPLVLTTLLGPCTIKPTSFASSAPSAKQQPKARPTSGSSCAAAPTTSAATRWHRKFWRRSRRCTRPCSDLGRGWW